MVADYPIRLFLLALAAWSVAAEVCAQSPIRVGYYDMVAGAGSPEQVSPIVAAGFTPVPLSNVTAADLTGLHVLMVQNPSPNVYGTEYLAGRPAIAAAVNSGMVLIIHDRVVTNIAMGARVGDILPGVTVPASIMAAKATNATVWNNIEITDLNSLVVNGPFGTITATSLDNGNQSLHGVVNIPGSPTLPQPRRGLLHTVNGAQTGLSQAVTFSYQFGTGQVIYSSIPLDNFLKGGGNNPPRDTFTNVYAPNLLTYAVCGLKAFPATVSATSATGHYGGTTALSANVKCGVIPVAGVSIDFSVNGVPVGSAPTDASGTATLANVSLGSSPASAIAVGSYPAGVAAAFAGTAQYGASTGTAALTVQKAPASISFDGSTLGNFVYNAAPHPAAGIVRGVFLEPLGAPSFSYADEHGVTSDVAPVNVGTYRVTASVPESANYLGTTAESNPKIKITPAALAVTAHDKTKLYGAAVPELTAAFDGFVGGENASVLSGTLTLTTNATAASTVDEYKIKPSGVVSNNYDIKFVDGTLTVTPAALTVRALDANKIYGADLPAFAASYDGFVLGETVDALSGPLHFDTDATEASAVGSYAVTPSGLHSHNYAIAFVAGTLTVSPAPLTVRADNKTKVYGATLPVLTASYDGFVLHDGPAVLGGSLLLATGVTAASGVGVYAITPSGLSSTNYTISFVPGTLAVTPAPLTVRAENTAKIYGAALPVFTARYEGLVLGETPGVLTGTLAFTTDATAASHVGRYSVTPSGLASTNYAITFVAGYLLNTPAPLKIRAEDKERLEGLPNPVLTVRYQGFVLDDSETSLDARPRVSTPADAKSPDGTYPIVVRGAADQDYAIEQVDGTLTVSPEGRMHGSGVVEAPDVRHHFRFEVRETLAWGQKGSLKLEIERKRGADDVFDSDVVANVVFKDNLDVTPGGKAQADTVTITGVGRWNRQLATFEAVATDSGEPGSESDAVVIKIFVGGKLVSTTNGTLKSGNIQSNRIPRRR